MAWIHLTQNCQVVGLEGNVLTLGFANAGARDSFVSSGCAEVVHQAAIDVVGADWKIETIVDPGAQPEGTPTVTKAATEPAPAAAAGRRRSHAEPSARAPPAWAADDEPTRPPERQRRRGAPPARRSSRPGRGCRGTAAPTTWPPPTRRPAATTSTRNPTSLGGEDLLARELGASMIEEIKHS